MAKREWATGRYTYDGRLERMCVCGHVLGDHSAGDGKDCLFYSLSAAGREGRPGNDKPSCGCERFRQSRKKVA